MIPRAKPDSMLFLISACAALEPILLGSHRAAIAGVAAECARRNRAADRPARDRSA
jgi:hypothetical protein